MVTDVIQHTTFAAITFIIIMIIEFAVFLVVLLLMDKSRIPKTLNLRFVAELRGT